MAKKGPKNAIKGGSAEEAELLHDTGTTQETIVGPAIEQERTVDPNAATAKTAAVPQKGVRITQPYTPTGNTGRFGQDRTNRVTPERIRSFGENEREIGEQISNPSTPESERALARQNLANIENGGTMEITPPELPGESITVDTKPPTNWLDDFIDERQASNSGVIDLALENSNLAPEVKASMKDNLAEADPDDEEETRAARVKPGSDKINTDSLPSLSQFMITHPKAIAETPEEAEPISKSGLSLVSVRMKPGTTPEQIEPLKDLNKHAHLIATSAVLSGGGTIVNFIIRSSDAKQFAKLVSLNQNSMAVGVGSQRVGMSKTPSGVIIFGADVDAINSHLFQSNSGTRITSEIISEEQGSIPKMPKEIDVAPKVARIPEMDRKKTFVVTIKLNSTKSSDLKKAHYAAISSIASDKYRCHMQICGDEVLIFAQNERPISIGKALQEICSYLDVTGLKYYPKFLQSTLKVSTGENTSVIDGDFLEDLGKAYMQKGKPGEIVVDKNSMQRFTTSRYADLGMQLAKRTTESGETYWVVEKFNPKIEPMERGFIGRKREKKEMDKLKKQANEGGQVFAIIGSAGVGKTEFARQTMPKNTLEIRPTTEDGTGKDKEELVQLAEKITTFANTHKVAISEYLLNIDAESCDREKFVEAFLETLQNISQASKEQNELFGLVFDDIDGFTPESLQAALQIIAAVKNNPQNYKNVLCGVTLRNDINYTEDSESEAKRESDAHAASYVAIQSLLQFYIPENQITINPITLGKDINGDITYTDDIEEFVAGHVIELLKQDHSLTPAQIAKIKVKDPTFFANILYKDTGIKQAHSKTALSVLADQYGNGSLHKLLRFSAPLEEGETSYWGDSEDFWDQFIHDHGADKFTELIAYTIKRAEGHGEKATANQIEEMVNTVLSELQADTDVEKYRTLATVIIKQTEKEKKEISMEQLERMLGIPIDAKQKAIVQLILKKAEEVTDRVTLEEIEQALQIDMQQYKDTFALSSFNTKKTNIIPWKHSLDTLRRVAQVKEEDGKILMSPHYGANSIMERFRRGNEIFFDPESLEIRIDYDAALASSSPTEPEGIQEKQFPRLDELEQKALIHGVLLEDLPETALKNIFVLKGSTPLSGPLSHLKAERRMFEAGKKVKPSGPWKKFIIQYLEEHPELDIQAKSKLLTALLELNESDGAHQGICAIKITNFAFDIAKTIDQEEKPKAYNNLMYLIATNSLEAAKEAIETNKPQEAEWCAKWAVRFRQDAAEHQADLFEAHLILARAHLSMEEYKEAKEAIDQANKFASSKEEKQRLHEVNLQYHYLTLKRQYLVNRSEVEEKQTNYQNAIEAAKPLYQTGYGKALIHYHQANLQKDSGEYASAIASTNIAGEILDDIDLTTSGIQARELLASNTYLKSAALMESARGKYHYDYFKIIAIYISEQDPQLNQLMIDANYHADQSLKMASEFQIQNSETKARASLCKALAAILSSKDPETIKTAIQSANAYAGFANTTIRDGLRTHLSMITLEACKGNPNMEPGLKQSLLRVNNDLTATLYESDPEGTKSYYAINYAEACIFKAAELVENGEPAETLRELKTAAKVLKERIDICKRDYYPEYIVLVAQHAAVAATLGATALEEFKETYKGILKTEEVQENEPQAPDEESIQAEKDIYYGLTAENDDIEAVGVLGLVELGKKKALQHLKVLLAS